MKNVVILGSTGSIGTQSLEVCREQNIQVVGLSANKNVALLLEQVKEFKPSYVAMMDESSADELRKAVGKEVKVLSGINGLCELATLDEAQIVVTAVVGMVGLKPTVQAIKAGKDIALANKETLVVAGEIIMKLAKEYGVKILPVDSEHSAIFQSLQGENYHKIKRIILTASGGPFRGKKIDELKNVTVEEALKHPNWSMGAKITIDSSTLVNKGLEVIEASHLFNVSHEKIDVVIHKESIVHSLVEFIDSSQMAQLGLPSMKLPISYALTYPNRTKTDYKKLDLSCVGSLSFEKPDLKTFRGLALAYEVLKQKSSMATVYNMANELAVRSFLHKEIKYLQIVDIIEKTMNKHNPFSVTSLDDIMAVQEWVKGVFKEGV